MSISQKYPEKKNIILYCGLCLRLPPHSCVIKMLSMATSFQKFRIWKENVLEELYRKCQGKTIKDDYGKNSKEFIDFANDMKKSMKINAAKYGLRLITFETGHYDMCGYFKDNERDFSSVLQKDWTIALEDTTTLRTWRDFSNFLYFFHNDHHFTTFS